MDLFSEAGSPTRPDAPLAARMRPSSLAEVVGQAHVLNPNSPLRRLLAGEPGTRARTSLILWGPPGTGKTTLATLVAKNAGDAFVELSAVTAGVREVRAVVDTAKRELELQGRGTVLFIDEVHRFSKTQQDALLPAVENGWVRLIAATTENPSFAVIPPLLSRGLLVPLRPLADAEVGALLDRAVADSRGLGGRVHLSEAARAQLVRLAGGDARRALTILEAAASGDSTAATALAEPGEAGPGLASPESEPSPESESEPVRSDRSEDPSAGQRITRARTITLSDVERVVSAAAPRYDRSGDQHYDITSALIKSVRGSDVDAALHYLARMVEAGEDPRFIARRLVILASEDIGMADPTALQTAVAAMQAVAFIGMPEARITLAQAVVHLSLAPKSNRVYAAINAAIADVRSGKSGPVPPQLRDSSTRSARIEGAGQGYQYPHDSEAGVVPVEYAPAEVAGAVYYQPTRHGAEERWGQTLERIRQGLGRQIHPG